MEFLTSTILSGIAYDMMKKGIVLTAEILREKLKGWILKDEDYIKSVEIINNASETDKKTEKYLEAFLDSNKDIQEILKRAVKDKQSSVVQDFSNTNVQKGGVVTGIMNGNVINNFASNEKDTKKKL